jgi:hypothetical protein
MIHPAPKMLHEEKWLTFFTPETAISKADPIRFNELGGGRRVPIRHAWLVPFCGVCTNSGYATASPP